jgi:hypothetical protein
VGALPCNLEDSNNLLLSPCCKLLTHPPLISSGRSEREVMESWSCLCPHPQFMSLPSLRKKVQTPQRRTLGPACPGDWPPLQGPSSLPPTVPAPLMFTISCLLEGSSKPVSPPPQGGGSSSIVVSTGGLSDVPTPTPPNRENGPLSAMHSFVEHITLLLEAPLASPLLRGGVREWASPHLCSEDQPEA